MSPEEQWKLKTTIEQLIKEGKFYEANDLTGKLHTGFQEYLGSDDDDDEDGDLVGV